MRAERAPIRSPLTMDQATHNKIVSFLWGIADDVLRDLFKRGKYPDHAWRMFPVQGVDFVNGLAECQEPRNEGARAGAKDPCRSARRAAGPAASISFSTPSV